MGTALQSQPTPGLHLVSRLGPAATQGGRLAVPQLHAGGGGPQLALLSGLSELPPYPTPSCEPGRVALEAVNWSSRRYTNGVVGNGSGGKVLPAPSASSLAEVLDWKLSLLEKASTESMITPCCPTYVTTLWS